MSELIAASINGQPCPPGQVGLLDRALHYGDGLFETMLVRQGEPVAFERHAARLRTGCERLGIAVPHDTTINQRIRDLLPSRTDAIIKMIVSRAGISRGYRGPIGAEPNVLLLVYEHTFSSGPRPITVRWCTTKLARNPGLAGIKHLNRLEQVLAQNEWQDASIAEGLMLDTEGELISGTATNVFVVSGGVLCTPDLRYCGIRGTMRARVIDAAQRLGMEVQEGALWPEDVLEASEVFVTNAIRGIQPVNALEQREWPIGPNASRIAATLDIW